MRTVRMLAIVLGALALVCPMAAYAGDAAGGGAKYTLSLTDQYTASPWTGETGYGERAVHKLGFGLKNLLLGWTDLFTEPHEASTSGGNVLHGIGVGLKDLVENELGGIVHIVTFPITGIDAPLPEGGVQFK